MWIQGYKLKYNEVPPQVICFIIQRQARGFASKVGCEFKASIHSEACYLLIDDKEIALRNHDGKNYGVVINLSKFRTWEDCEKYLRRRFITKEMR